MCTAGKTLIILKFSKTMSLCAKLKIPLKILNIIFPDLFHSSVFLFFFSKKKKHIFFHFMFLCINNVNGVYSINKEAVLQVLYFADIKKQILFLMKAITSAMKSHFRHSTKLHVILGFLFKDIIKSKAVLKLFFRKKHHIMQILSVVLT